MSLSLHLKGFEHVVAVFDENTCVFCDELKSLVGRLAIRFDQLVMPSSGEGIKSPQQYYWLVEKTVRLHFLRRRSTFLAVGGGSVIDLVGFVAATFQRGVSYLNVPTTLLAMVDAAIGGKVGINLPAGKHLLGAFHYPHAVIIDTKKLTTLQSRSFKSGFPEIIKIALINGDPDLFTTLEAAAKHDKHCETSLIKYLIEQSIRAKLKFVERDWQEEDLDRLLNLGHEIAHVLEAASGFEDQLITHGEAVAIGLLTASQLSTSRGLLSDSIFKRICDLITQLCYLPPVHLWLSRSFCQHLSVIEEIRDGNLRVAMPMTSIGVSAVFHDVRSDELLLALDHVIAMIAAYHQSER